jgi:Na+-driven multidrug efflux pump
MMLSGPLLSLIDTSVVGLAASTAQLAALGPSTKACDHLAYLCSALGVACTSLAAKELADGRTGSANRVVATSLTSALAIGIGLAVALAACAAPVMKLMMGAAPDPISLAGAVQYTSIRALGYPAALVAMVLQAGFIAHRDSKSPMMAVPFAAAANLLLDLILVGPLRLGAAGAAWGTVASQIVSAAFLLGIWKRKHGRPARTAPAWSPSQGGAPSAPAPATPLRWWNPRSWRHQMPSAHHRALAGSSSVRSLFARPRRADVAAQAAVVAPMMLAIGARSSMALTLTATVASLGTIPLAAHQVFECLYWLFSPFGDALGVCSQAYMPKLLSAREELARKMQRRVSVASAALGAASGVAIFGLALGAPQLFTRHAAVHTAMAAPAGWIGLAMVAYIISGALEGSMLARRKLRMLAASHVTNLVFALAALRAIAGQPGFGLVQVWQIYFGVNLAKVVQFGAALHVGGRQARRDEARRDEARRQAAGWQGAWDGAPLGGGGGDLSWQEASASELRLDGRKLCLNGVGEAPEPRSPRLVHVSEQSLYDLINEAMPDMDDAPPHQRRMQP